jgi:hypothetical protein
MGTNLAMARGFKVSKIIKSNMAARRNLFNKCFSLLLRTYRPYLNIRNNEKTRTHSLTVTFITQNNVSPQNFEREDERDEYRTHNTTKPRVGVFVMVGGLTCIYGITNKENTPSKRVRGKSGRFSTPKKEYKLVKNVDRCQGLREYQQQRTKRKLDFAPDSDENSPAKRETRASQVRLWSFLTRVTH